jgi:hypothetical protein
MNLTESNTEVKKFFEEVCLPLLESKGSDYIGGKEQNAFQNFKDGAQANGITKYQVWGVLFNKHIGSIFTYIKKRKVESESIDSRIADAINYLFILRNMLKEDNCPKFQLTVGGQPEDET